MNNLRKHTKSNAGTPLTELRNEIDAIDQSIFELLQRRFKIAQRIGRQKSKSGLPVQDKTREQEVLSRINSATSNELMRSSLRSVYNEIFNQSRAAQEAVDVIYL